jgi:putative ABC transport system permease protein
MKIQNLSSIFALIAIAISCLGLFGLVVFTINQHTKEIAIRKVLGANIPTLLGFLSIDFLKIVSFSFLIAAPISWYFAHKWIQGFAFHITIGWWIFAFAGLMVLCVAMATVCLLTLRAAMANPVKSLRME